MAAVWLAPVGRPGVPGRRGSSRVRRRGGTLYADHARAAGREVGVVVAQVMAASARAGDPGIRLAVGAQEVGQLRHAFLADDVLFFFQAEDGIRDYKVTGVQTCALPI